MKKKLSKLVRQVVQDLDKVGPEQASVIVKPLRKFGIAPGVHVGRKDLNPEETVEWYAGQILDIVDNKSWFAVNSIINLLDKFVPED